MMKGDCGGGQEERREEAKEEENNARLSLAGAKPPWAENLTK